MKEVVSHLSKLSCICMLDLNRLVAGSDEASVAALSQLITSLPRLTTLRLAANGFNPTAIQMLCKSLSQLSGLTHLDLARSALNEPSMTAFGEVVARVPLLHLVLDGTTWEAGGFEALVAPFATWPHLKALKLSGLELDEAKATLLATHLPQLTSLTMLDIRRTNSEKYVDLLIPAVQPLQVLFLSAPKESETTLKEAFPSKCVVYQLDDAFLIHDASLPPLEYVEYIARYIKPVPRAELQPRPLTPAYWNHFNTFKPIEEKEVEGYLMQPMLYRHLRYPEQVHRLATVCDVSFLKAILLHKTLKPTDMETALKYHRWSEIVGYNPGLTQSGDYIQQHLEPSNLVSSFAFFHELKQTMLPTRDATGEHTNATGKTDELVCWDGLLSYFPIKWKEWEDDNVTEMLQATKRKSDGEKLMTLELKALMEHNLKCDWTMKEDCDGDWERRQALFKTTYHFLHLSPALRPDMTVVINNGFKVMHLHSHVVSKRWGLFNNLLKCESLAIYHLDATAEMAEVIACLMEYCYTGDLDKLACLTPSQFELIGQVEATQIYSTAALLPNQPQTLDPGLMNWCQAQLPSNTLPDQYLVQAGI